ncbi:MAG: BspA family leucine-rich repeat surface protein [Candidatus Woesearchaeota archaeon]
MNKVILSLIILIGVLLFSFTSFVGITGLVIGDDEIILLTNDNIFYDSTIVNTKHIGISFSGFHSGNNFEIFKVGDGSERVYANTIPGHFEFFYETNNEVTEVTFMFKYNGIIEDYSKEVVQDSGMVMFGDGPVFGILDTNEDCVGGPSDLNCWSEPSVLAWGPFDVTGYNSDDDGRANTAGLVALGGYPAAEHCYNLIEGDVPVGTWYLPAKNQLWEGYISSHGETTFTDSFYWSSTEFSGVSAFQWVWGLYTEQDGLYSNGMYDSFKDASPNPVRCLRDPEPVNNFYLHENGITVLCPDAEVGETGIVNGITYTAYDNDGLYAIRDNTELLETACTSLITSFNPTMNWNGGLFYNSDLNPNVSHWDIGNALYTGFMFFSASNFNQDISSWDVSNVIIMLGMFDGATSFNQNLSSWDVSNVTNMWGMFQGASSFNQDLSGWCVTQILSKPGDFDTGATSWAGGDSTRPQWGSCPELNLFAGGNGTVANPFQITTWTQLDAMRLNLSAHYVLMNDLISEDDDYLDFNNPNTEGWEPIGDNENRFTGSFDGQGNIIEGLFINRSSESKVGFFGYVKNGEIKNVHLTENYIKGGSKVGGIVGYSLGIIFNSSSSGTVSGTGDFVGGIAGFVSSISNSYSTGKVSGISNVGGLFGSSESGLFFNSYSTGNVSGISNVGGFAGAQFVGSIFNSYSIGNVSGISNVGGFIGFITEEISFQNSYWNTETSVQVEGIGSGPSGDGSMPEGKTTEEMKQISTFSEWDIVYSDEDLNDGYPYLSWQAESDEAVWMIYQEDSGHLIVNKPSDIIVVDKDSRMINLSEVGQNNVIRSVIIKDEKVISEFDINFSRNINFSNVIVDYGNLTIGEVDYGRSVIHIPNELDDVISEVILFIPEVAGTGRVFICPDAESLEDVNESCTNIYYENLIAVDGFYNISVSGTGGGEGSPLFYLHENGVTILCPDAEVGETGVVNGITYTAYDNDGLYAIRDNEELLETACTSHVTSFNPSGNWNTGLFYNSVLGFQPNISHWDTSSVISMFAMFYSSQFNGDISIWDTSLIADMGYMFFNSQFNQDISNWDTSSVTSMFVMFAYSSFNQDISNWNTSLVTSMSSMFEGSLFNNNISNWDVSKVINMDSMFTDSQFNQDISNWNVSSVTMMAGMFAGATFDQDISNWDVSKVIDMEVMFRDSPFNGDISNWNVSSAEVMTQMFMGSQFNGDISNWNVSSVNDMHSMFYSAEYFNQDLSGWCVEKIGSKPTGFDDGASNWSLPRPVWGSCPNRNFYLHTNGITVMCPNAEVGETGVVGGVEYTAYNSTTLYAVRTNATALETACTSLVDSFNPSGDWNGGLFYNSGEGFQPNISSWDVSSVTNMRGMFVVSHFDGDISDWNTSSVEDMARMFNNAINFNQDISNWDTSSVTDMSSMFMMAGPFNQPIGLWNTSSVIYMNSMFNGAGGFNQDISSWDTSSVITMASMFSDTYSFNQDISNWNTSKVQSMVWMFADSKVFQQNLSDFYTGSVTDMSSMFQDSSFDGDISGWDVSSVNSMANMFFNSQFNNDISDWNVSSVTNMLGMFAESHFNQDISNWDTSSVTHMSGMFDSSPFNQDISNWDTSSVTDMSWMFAWSSFNQDISNWDVSNVTNMNWMFMDAGSFNQDLSGWCVSQIPTKPNGFDDGANSWEGGDATRPQWGSCPGSEVLPVILLDRIEPLDNIIINQNELFNITVNVTCLDANCGDVNVSFDPFEEYEIIAFTDIGSHTWTVPQGVTEIELLVVAGGGGGENISDGGGGGAGGLIYYGPASPSLGNYYSVTPGEVIDIYVGDGGLRGNTGENSIFGDLVALGGGSRVGTGNKHGGSGAGGGHASPSGGIGLQPTSASGGFGHDGGTKISTNEGSGGGGAGSPGEAPPQNVGGAGGLGLYYGDTFGDNYGDSGWFASGGSGGGERVANIPPLGGGGMGGLGTTQEERDGMPNTGGGGGGNNEGSSNNNNLRNAGKGGSGIIIVKYKNVEKEGLISINSGDLPFYTTSLENPVTINLDEGESQLITIWVNATGSSGNYTFFEFVNVTSNMSISNRTSDWNVTIFVPAEQICPNDWVGQGTKENPCQVTECGIISQPNLHYRVINNIPGEDYCFAIYAENITMDGFGNNIISSGNFYAIFINSSNVVVKNFANISYFASAIYSENVNNITIYNNSFYNSLNSAFYLLGSEFNISNNKIDTVSNTGSSGMYLTVNNSIVKNNTLIDAGYWSSSIYLLNSNTNIIYGNNILINNYDGYGIYTYGNSIGNIVLNNNLSSINPFILGAILNLLPENYLKFNNSYGSIDLIDTGLAVNLFNYNLTFPGHFIISNNSAFINQSYYAGTDLDAGYNISLLFSEALSYTNPIIFKNGIECFECFNFTELNQNEIIFNVSTAGNYSIGENPNYLIIHSVNHTPESPTDEDLINITINVTNTLGDLICNLTGDLGEFSQSLSQGIEQEIIFELSSYNLGLYNYNIICSDDYSIENSNGHSLRVYNVPNLYVKSLDFSKVNPLPGETISIMAVIGSDYGNSENVKVAFYNYDNQINLLNIPFIAKDSEAQVSFQHSFMEEGLYLIKVSANYDNSIIETTYDDNNLSRLIEVGNVEEGNISVNFVLNPNPVNYLASFNVVGNAYYDFFPFAAVAGGTVLINLEGDSINDDRVITAYTNSLGQFSVSNIFANNTAGSYLVNVTVSDNTVLGSNFSFIDIISTELQYPDLAVYSGDLTLNESIPLEGDLVRILAKVRNVGANITDALVHFYVGNEFIGDYNIYNLDGYGNYTMAYIDWIFSAGTNNIRVAVDPYNDIIEESIHNNNRSINRKIFLNAADLNPYSIVASNTNPLVGEQITITAYVRNLEGLVSEPTFINYSANNDPIATNVLPSINPNSIQTNQITHIFTEPGIYSIKVAVNENQDQEESSYSNNNYTRTNYIIVQDAYKPDFVVSNIRSSTLYHGNVRTINIDVANVGNGNTSEEITVDLYLNNELIGSESWNGLNSGQQHTVMINHNFTNFGNVNLKASVNDNRNIEEESYSNNNMTRTFYVYQPNLEILSTDITFVPAEPTVGDDVLVNLIIRNKDPAIAHNVTYSFFTISETLSSGVTTVPALGTVNVQALLENVDFVGPKLIYASVGDNYKSYESDSLNNNATRTLLVYEDTFVSDCRILNTSNTVYYLVDNIYSYSENCILITAENIVLDGNGYNYTGSNFGLGVNITSVENITLKNLNMFNFEYGIYSLASNTIIYNNNITNSSYGINLYNNSGLIYNNNIDLFNRALNIYGNNSILHSNLLHYSVHNPGFISELIGIYSNICYNNEYYNNTMLNLSYGLYFDSCVNLIIYDNIYFNTYENYIRFVNTNNSIIRNELMESNASYGIYLSDSSNNNLFRDLLIGSSKIYDINSIKNSYNNTFLNVTYSTENVSHNSNLSRKWYIDILVTNMTGIPLSLSNVIAYSSRGSIEILGVTDLEGYILSEHITEYVNNGSMQYYSNYSFNATKDGYDPNSTFVNITGNSNILIQLLKTPQCRDGIDNDGDGFIDYPDDPGCESPDDDDETGSNLPVLCNFNIDCGQSSIVNYCDGLELITNTTVPYCENPGNFMSYCTNVSVISSINCNISCSDSLGCDFNDDNTVISPGQPGSSSRSSWRVLREPEVIEIEEEEFEEIYEEEVEEQIIEEYVPDTIEEIVVPQEKFNRFIFRIGNKEVYLLNLEEFSDDDLTKINIEVNLNRDRRTMYADFIANMDNVKYNGSYIIGIDENIPQSGNYLAVAKIFYKGSLIDTQVIEVKR